MTTIQFVADMTSDAPAVLLDLNSSPITLAPGYDFGAASFDKGWATSPLRHGGRLTRSVAGIKQMNIPLQVVSPTAAGFSAAVETLGRLLMTNGYLRVQFSNSSRPVFFRYFADPDYSISIRGILSCAVQYQVITLTLYTDPFAYGPRVEVSGSPFTVSNDPAAVTNPMRFDVTGVQGDVPTPMLLVATSTAVTGNPSGFAGKWTHLGVRNRGTPSNYSNVIQAEDMSLDTNAAVVVDAAMSNGNKVTITPGTIGMVLRVHDTFPGNGTAVVDARGLYRVYARVQKSNAADVWSMQFGYGASSTSPVLNDAQGVPTVANTGPWMVDLGYLPCPAWADPIYHGFSGTLMKCVVPFVGVYAQRVSGTGTLQIDYLYFVPADESTIIVAWPDDLAQYAIDGTTEAGGSCYATTTALDEVITTSRSAQITSGGGFPELVPGQTNRIHLVREVDLTGLGLDPVLGNTTTIRVFCWPRWRNVTRTP